MDSIFQSENLNKKYLNNGFITVDLLKSEEINKLIEIYHKYDKNYNELFYCSNWTTDCAERLNEHNEISRIIGPKISDKLSGYKILYSCFITKRRSIHSKVHPHIDWQFVAEPKSIAFNIWIPLSNTNCLSGNLWVSKRSHQYFNEKRGPNIELDINKELYSNKLNINLKAGQGIIYDTRLIHGSNRNMISNKRIAIAIIVVPENAPVLHHFADPVTKEIHTYEVDNNFYIERCIFRKNNNFYWELSPGTT